MTTVHVYTLTFPYPSRHPVFSGPHRVERARSISSDRVNKQKRLSRLRKRSDAYVYILSTRSVIRKFVVRQEGSVENRNLGASPLNVAVCNM